MPATLLIVDDEKNTREGLYQVLENNYNVHLARDVDEACKLLEKKSFDIVLTDLKMAGKSGMSVIDYCFKMPSNPVCIMITAYSNIETAVKAVKKGAFDFLKKPINLEKLEITIKRALKYHNSKKNTLKLSSSLKKKNTLPLIAKDFNAKKMMLRPQSCLHFLIAQNRVFSVATFA